MDAESKQRGEMEIFGGGPMSGGLHDTVQLVDGPGSLFIVLSIVAR